MADGFESFGGLPGPFQRESDAVMDGGVSGRAPGRFGAEKICRGRVRKLRGERRENKRVSRQSIGGVGERGSGAALHLPDRVFAHGAS